MSAKVIRKFQYIPDGRNIPMRIECYCGHQLDVPEFTNTCLECYRDYNSSGQLLANRSQWGEETGESLSDILNIGHWEE